MERAQRSVGIDELFALALALETTVVKLLDPWGVAGQRRDGVDLGLESGLTGPHEARAYILTTDNPFGLQPDIGITWDGNIPNTMFTSAFVHYQPGNLRATIKAHMQTHTSNLEEFVGRHLQVCAADGCTNLVPPNRRLYCSPQCMRRMKQKRHRARKK